jgi:hypothetical protein
MSAAEDATCGPALLRNRSSKYWGALFVGDRNSPCEDLTTHATIQITEQVIKQRGKAA